jgi:hypothetical protein
MCFQIYVPPNTGGNITFNNTYMYGSQDEDGGFALVFQDTQIPGQYGYLNNQGGYFSWVTQGPISSVIYNFYFERNTFQEWEVLQLSTTQSVNGWYVDPNVGLILVGDLAAFWQAWLGKGLFTTLWLKTY